MSNVGFGFVETKRARETILAAAKNSVVELEDFVSVSVDAGTVHHVAFSADDKLIYVGLSTGAVWIYRTGRIKMGSSAPIHKVQVADAGIHTMRPNPEAFPDICVVLDVNNQLAITRTPDKVDKLPIKATCLCWSRKGKQLVVGTEGGILKQITVEGVVKNEIKPPDAFANKPDVKDQDSCPQMTIPTKFEDEESAAEPIVKESKPSKPAQSKEIEAAKSQGSAESSKPAAPSLFSNAQTQPTPFKAPENAATLPAVDKPPSISFGTAAISDTAKAPSFSFSPQPNDATKQPISFGNLQGSSAQKPLQLFGSAVGSSVSKPEGVKSDFSFGGASGFGSPANKPPAKPEASAAEGGQQKVSFGSALPQKPQTAAAPLKMSPFANPSAKAPAQPEPPKLFGTPLQKPAVSQKAEPAQKKEVDEKPVALQDPKKLPLLQVFDHIYKEVTAEIEESKVQVKNLVAAIEESEKITGSLSGSSKMGDIPLLTSVVSDYAEEAKSLSAKTKLIDTVRNEITEAILITEAKRGQCDKLISILKGETSLDTNVGYGLGPEQEMLQAKLRKKLMYFEETLRTVNYSLLEIEKHTNATLGSSRINYDWDTICRNARRMTAFSLEVSARVDGLAKEFRKLLTPPSVKSTPVKGVSKFAVDDSDDSNDSLRPSTFGSVSSTIVQKRHFLNELKDAFEKNAAKIVRVTARPAEPPLPLEELCQLYRDKLVSPKKSKAPPTPITAAEAAKAPESPQRIAQMAPSSSGPSAFTNVSGQPPVSAASAFPSFAKSQATLSEASAFPSFAPPQATSSGVSAFPTLSFAATAPAIKPLFPVQAPVASKTNPAEFEEEDVKSLNSEEEKTEEFEQEDYEEDGENYDDEGEEGEEYYDEFSQEGEEVYEEDEDYSDVNADEISESAGEESGLTSQNNAPITFGVGLSKQSESKKSAFAFATSSDGPKSSSSFTVSTQSSTKSAFNFAATDNTATQMKPSTEGASTKADEPKISFGFATITKNSTEAKMGKEDVSSDADKPKVGIAFGAAKSNEAKASSDSDKPSRIPQFNSAIPSSTKEPASAITFGSTNAATPSFFSSLTTKTDTTAPFAAQNKAVSAFGTVSFASPFATPKFEAKPVSDEKSMTGSTSPVKEEKPSSSRSSPAKEEGTASERSSPVKAEEPGSGLFSPVTKDKSASGRSSPLKEDKSASGRLSPVKDEKPVSGRSSPVKEEEPNSGRSSPVKDEKQAMGRSSPAKEVESSPGRSSPVKEENSFKEVPSKKDQGVDELSSRNKEASLMEASQPAESKSNTQATPVFSNSKAISSETSANT
ncbi:hypothetical protein HDV05_005288 [Chytridiales sp. JEL 0842]|nr:hypothetical protein HDV05_005288 [Chytridiales sp. JEL 0842]